MFGEYVRCPVCGRYTRVDEGTVLVTCDSCGRSFLKGAALRPYVSPKDVEVDICDTGQSKRCLAGGNEMDFANNQLLLYVWEDIPINAYAVASLIVVARTELEALRLAEKIIQEETERGNYMPPEGYTAADVLKISERPRAWWIIQNRELPEFTRTPGQLIIHYF